MAVANVLSLKVLQQVILTDVFLKLKKEKEQQLAPAS